MPSPLIGWAGTILFVALSWVLFRAPDMTTANAFYLSLLGKHALGVVPDFSATAYLMLGVLWVLTERAWLELKSNLYYAIFIATLGFVSLLSLGTDYKFIYFQF